MMYHPDRRAPVPYRHVERIHHELGAQCVTHRPPDDPAAPRIQHCRQVKPPLASCDVGNVCDPEPIGRGGCKIALHEVWCRHGLAILPRRPSVAPALGTHQVRLAHQPRDPLSPASHALRLQLGVDSRRSVRPTTSFMNGLDLVEERLIRPRSHR